MQSCLVDALSLHSDCCMCLHAPAIVWFATGRLPFISMRTPRFVLNSLFVDSRVAMQLRSPWAVPGRNRQPIQITQELPMAEAPRWPFNYKTGPCSFRHLAMCRSAQTVSFLRSVHAWPDQLLSRICSRQAPGWNTAAVESRMELLKCFQHGRRPRCSSHSHHYDAVLHYVAAVDKNAPVSIYLCP